MYRRNLPHIETSDRPYFVSYKTEPPIVLAPEQRDLALRSILYEHRKMIDLVATVVMPNHVHMIFFMNEFFEGSEVTLALVMNRLKGPSSHAINKQLGRRGTVWQQESFDRLIRSDEELREKLFYIECNPVEARLVSKPSDYRWLWLANLDDSEDS